jgi:hypothetical protein
MANTERVLAAIGRILRPLVRILIRSGVPSDALTEVVRKTYVDIAEEEFPLEGKRQTVSRISVITGLHRKEVARLRALQAIDVSADVAGRNRAAAVLSAWLRDKDFLDRKGDPLDLPFLGSISFSELVRRYSGDMKPRAMADELIASGAIEIVGRRLRMSARGYLPGSAPAEMVAILGTDPAQLIETIDHNMQSSERRYQRKVEYDNVPAEYAQEFRALSARLGQHVLEELDRWLAARDLGRKSSPDATLTLGVGIFQIEQAGRNSGRDSPNRKEHHQDGK